MPHPQNSSCTRARPGEVNRVYPDQMKNTTLPNPGHPHAWQEHTVYGTSTTLVGHEGIREVPPNGKYAAYYKQ